MDFKSFVEQEKQKPYYQELKQKIDDEYAHYTVYPPKKEIFRCLNLTHYEDVKVVILGQDPYHGPHQANGLSFSVRPGVEIPPSLVNIFKECHDDVGCDVPNNGDLTPWAKQGVLLLNNVLTVRAHQANSHRFYGWEEFTLNVVKFLNAREKPMVFLLWGGNAKRKKALITNPNHLILETVHPSPLSAYGGFFGCRHFSKAAEFLRQHGDDIDWSLD